MQTTASIAIGILFIVTGGVKVIGLRQSLDIRDHFGIQPQAWRLLGGVETLGGGSVLIGLAWHPLRSAALVGLALLMLGATGSRVRVRDAFGWIALDVLVLAVAVATLIWTL
jgi:hypothetical protein